jgi:hypothetical protein
MKSLHQYITLYFLVALTTFSALKPHGFGKHTLVKEIDDYHLAPVGQIAQNVEGGKRQYVASYDADAREWINKRVVAAGYSETNCYCRLSFDELSSRSLECTPPQLFYRVDDHQWVAAYMLRIGDLLLCNGGRTVEIASVALIEKRLTVYTLEIKDTHTFLVTEHGIVVHNMLVPVATAIGLGIPAVNFGCGGASLGAILGPVGIAGGIVIGGAIGYLVHACMKGATAQYELSFNPGAIIRFMKANAYKADLKSVEDILEGTSPGRETAGKAKQYIKKGGYSEAISDFESLGAEKVKDMVGKEGKIGVLPDGRSINVRVESHDGRPTLEVQPIGKKGKVIKIRYEENV